MTRIFVVTSITLSLILALSGCASGIMYWQCDQTEAWAKVGARDGSRGLPKDERLGRHRTWCKEKAVTNASDVYNEGYDVGVLKYCTYETGFEIGKKYSDASAGYVFRYVDREYKNVCPKSIEPMFLSGYLSGIETKIARISKILERSRRRLSTAQAFLPHPDMQEFLIKNDIERFLSIHGKWIEQEAESAQRIAELEPEMSQLIAVRNKWEAATNTKN